MRLIHRTNMQSTFQMIRKFSLQMLKDHLNKNSIKEVFNMSSSDSTRGGLKKKRNEELPKSFCLNMSEVKKEVERHFTSPSELDYRKLIKEQFLLPLMVQLSQMNLTQEQSAIFELNDPQAIGSDFTPDVFASLRRKYI